MGGNTTRTKDAIPDILERIRHGESATSACKANKLHISTFLEFVAKDENLAKRYARAREVGLELLADELIALSDDVPAEKNEVNKARLQIDTRKWVLSKLLPKRYGDRQTLEHTGEGGGAVVLEVVTGIPHAPGEGEQG